MSAGSAAADWLGKVLYWPLFCCFSWLALCVAEAFITFVFHRHSNPPQLWTPSSEIRQAALQAAAPQQAVAGASLQAAAMTDAEHWSLHLGPTAAA
jgi:hypothetical protein